MASVIKNTLGYLGVDFQFRLVNSFIERPNFFRDLYSIIDQNMFTDVYLKIIVGIMKEYFKKHDCVPSYDLIKIEINEKAFDEDDAQFYLETIAKLKSTSTEGIDEIEDLAEKFFKQQNWVRVANEIRKIAGDGDISKYDECHKLMEEALSVGRHDDHEFSPFENIDGILEPDNIVSIPTGVDRLDEALGGGLDKGKLGLIIAAAGCGKTSMTTGFSAFAATCKTEHNNYEGYRVLHLFFEDTVRDISRKYVSRLTQVETCKLNENSETTSEAKVLLQNHPDKEAINNNVRLIRLKSTNTTATTIRDLIKKQINQGFKPDMVVVDYFGCVEAEKGYKNEAKWDQEGRTMRLFENMAQEFDVAMWIPVQSNRNGLSGSGDETAMLTMSDVGGSIKTVQIAQVVLSIARSVEDTNEKRATLALLKNRSGSAGIVLNDIRFDNGTCTLVCDDVVPFDDISSFNEFAENKEKEIRSNMTRDMMKNI